MVHWYVFVREPQNFSSESVIFDVSCGQGVRQQKALQVVKRYAADFGAYLQIRSDIADQVINSLCNRAFPHKRFAHMYAKRVRISICELAERLSKNLLCELEKPVNVGRRWIQTLSRFDSKFSCKFSQGRRLKPAQSETRKNLSQQREPTLEEVIIAMILVPILFVIVGAMEHYESILLY